MLQLFAHRLSVAYFPVQDRFVNDRDQGGRVRRLEYSLAVNPRGYVTLDLVRVLRSLPCQEQRTGIIGRLEQPGDKQRFPPADNTRLPLRVDPFLEPWRI